MFLSQLLRKGSVIGDLDVTSRKLVLQAIAERASELSDVSQSTIFELLLLREKLGSTSIGDGVAIPHAKLSGLSSVFLVFARIKKPVDFDSLDGKPVDLVAALFAPEKAGADHLKALAKVARSFGNDAFVERLRQCADDDALEHLLSLQEADAA